MHEYEISDPYGVIRRLLVCHAHEECVLGRHQAAVERQVILRFEFRPTGVHAHDRNGNRPDATGKADERDAPRAAWFALDVSLALQRGQEVRHGFRARDAAMPGDLAHARLERAFREKIEQEAVDLLLDRRERRARHALPARPSRCRSAAEMRASDFSRPSAMRTSKMPGLTVSPVSATRSGWKIAPPLTPRSSASVRSAGSMESV